MPRQKGITGLVLDRKSRLWHIDKYVHGYGRLCESTHERSRTSAEAYLARRLIEIHAHLDALKANGGVPRRTFAEAAIA